MLSPAARLAALRSLMTQHGLQAYWVPSEDAHQSEYTAPWDNRRGWLSGFTGSAGFAMITQEKAALWTDGRYFLQAERQLDLSCWSLMRAGLKETASKEEWLAGCLKEGRVGVDGRLVSHEAASKFADQLAQRGLKLELMTVNLVDECWADERPRVDLKPIEVLPMQFAGREATDKIHSLRTQIASLGASAMLITSLDEVCYVKPVFFAYCLVSAEQVTLFCAEHCLTSEARSHLISIHCQVRPYDEVYSAITAYRSADTKRLLVSIFCNAALVQAAGGPDRVLVKTSPVELEKAIKNVVEQEGFRQCHIRDGAAVVSYLAWLEDQLHQGKRVNECEGADKLLQFRLQQQYCQGVSFDTISGYGPNGAIIHYKPEPETCAQIGTDSLYLLDSGGQYFDGTTDITRTVHFGTPTAQQREAFTRVLKGNIQLNMACFPIGTSGMQLDAIARMPLWASGLDYRHGTGHGVGHYLNVHEGPHGISYHIRSHDHSLKAGMTVTDEPGFYLDGHWGIRIENVLLVKEAKLPYNFGGVGYLQFECVTMCPIQRSLIDINLLGSECLAWLNAYHQEVWTKVSPLLPAGSLAHSWLHRETRPL